MDKLQFLVLINVNNGQLKFNSVFTHVAIKFCIARLASLHGVFLVIDTE